MTDDERIDLALQKAERIVANGGGSVDFAQMMLLAKAIVLLKERLDYSRSHPFERLQELGFKIDERRIPQADAALVVEVCHELMNRALRNETDDGEPDDPYSKIYRDQEAALRRTLALVNGGSPNA